MVSGGLAGEESDKETVTAVSEAYSDHVQGWGGGRVIDGGNDGLPHKKDLGVSGYRYCRDNLEDMCGGVKLSDKVDLDRT